MRGLTPLMPRGVSARGAAPGPWFEDAIASGGHAPEEPPNPLRLDGLYHPLCFLCCGWRHRALIRRLVWRKIQAQYRGSVFGLLWTLLQPLLLLAVYTFVFSIVFRARWGEVGSNTEFALFVFSGMILYAVFSRCANESPSLLASHQTYIKQLVFPSEVLPWVSAIAALFDFVVGLGLLIVFRLGLGEPVPATSLLLPLMILPTLLLTLAFVWLIAPLGVFLKDVSQVVGLFTTSLLFLSPIFYPLSRIPEWLQPYFRLNPFVGILEMARGSLFQGRLPDWEALATLTGLTWLGAWLGYAWFMRSKSSLADAL